MSVFLQALCDLCISKTPYQDRLKEYQAIELYSHLEHVIDVQVVTYCFLGFPALPSGKKNALFLGEWIDDNPEALPVLHTMNRHECFLFMLNTRASHRIFKEEISLNRAMLDSSSYALLTGHGMCSACMC